MKIGTVDIPLAGLLGHGDAFVLRDPRSSSHLWYEDDEICVVASERPAIQTAFNLQVEEERIEPGHALIVKKDGSVREHLINEPTKV